MTVAPLAGFTARGVKRRFGFLCPLLRFGRFGLSRATTCAGNVDFVAGNDSIRWVRDDAIVGGDSRFDLDFVAQIPRYCNMLEDDASLAADGRDLQSALVEDRLGHGVLRCRRILEDGVERLAVIAICMSVTFGEEC